MIHINSSNVRELASSLRSLRLSSRFATQMTPAVHASPEAALRAFLWSAAICHSTKGGLKGQFGGNFYKGWDYLLRAFCAAAEDAEEAVSPETIRFITGSSLQNLLARHADNVQIELPDVDRRARILNKCANELEHAFFGSVTELLAQADHKVGGPNGAYARLAQLEAFRDPLKKKSSAFLTTVHFSGIWAVEDHENVVPMIDYHRMRVLCRTGCIMIEDSQVLQALVSQEPVSPVIETTIREAAADVCIEAASVVGMPMYIFDNLLWAHARSCCRHHPVCVGGQLEHDSFYNFVESEFTGTCVFQRWCPGYRDSISRTIWEPFVSTEDY